MSESGRASWTLPQDQFIVDALLLQMQKGKKADNGFKKEAWTEVVQQFNAKFGVNYCVQQLKSRLQQLKAEYKVFRALKENSGFGWDEEKQVPTAPDEVWASYIESHKRAAKYRKRPLVLYDKLLDLFEGTVATGTYALGPSLVTDTTDSNRDKDGEYDSQDVGDREDPGSSSQSPSLKREREASPNTPPPTKRSPSSRRKTAAEALSDSIEKLTASRNQFTKPAETWSTVAVGELFTNMAAGMSEDQVNLALLVLEDSTKAGVFCKIPKGRSRELWLQMQIRQKQADAHPN